MLKTAKFDVLFIASPPFLHEQQIEAAVATGKPVVCEKPLAPNLASALRIAEVVKASGRPFMLAHHLRHHPMLMRVKDLITSGELGAIRRADFEWSFSLNRDASNARWKADPELGGPTALYDAGIHAVDLAIHLFGAPSLVFGATFNTAAIQTADNAIALLQYPDLLVTVSASQVLRNSPNDLLIEGEQGYVTAPAFLREAGGKLLQIRRGDDCDHERFDPVNLYAAEIEAFVAALREGRTGVGTTIDEALLGSRVLDAVDRSQLSKRAVGLEYP